MTFLQTIVIGLIQGLAELFPVSSLGQTILIPSLIGGSWSQLVAQEASPQSPYLAFVVGLHVATAAALISFFWREWVRIIRGFFSRLRRGRIQTPNERLAWLIVVATIPVGLLGLALEHPLRTLFAKPVAAAAFLTINGLILLTGEALRRRQAAGAAMANAIVGHTAPPEGIGSSSKHADPADELQSPAALSFRDTIGIGIAQSSALLAGISRDGVCWSSAWLAG